jgi:hypothetical protein
MMSVLCLRKQQEILFCKGAPESIFSRCTSVLCNDDGSAVPMTAEICAELEERLYRYPVYICPLFYSSFSIPKARHIHNMQCSL